MYVHLFLTGQWLFESPLHYLQLWLDVRIIVTLCTYHSLLYHAVYDTLQSAKQSLSRCLMIRKAEVSQVTLTLVLHVHTHNYTIIHIIIVVICNHL